MCLFLVFAIVFLRLRVVGNLVYLCLMRYGILLIFLAFLGGHMAAAQDRPWVKVPDNETGVFVQMPDLPAFEQRRTWLIGRLFSQDIFSASADRLLMRYEITTLGDLETKAYSAIRKEAQKELMARTGCEIQKREKLIKDKLKYTYFEATLQSGHLIRGVVFIERGKMFMIWLEGAMSEAYSIQANRFLGSWELGAPVYLPEISQHEDGTIEISEPDIYGTDWTTVDINEDFQASFPDIPFHRRVFLELDRWDAEIDTYSRFSEKGRLHFVVTVRPYGSEEGYLHDKALYEYVLLQILSATKFKLHDRSSIALNGYAAEAFVLSKGLRFYRFVIVRKGDQLYQCMVKGKRKSIYSAESEQFFSQVKISTD